MLFSDFSFSLVFGIVSFRFYKSKQKANQVLSSMNSKVTAQKEELASQAEVLKAQSGELRAQSEKLKATNDELIQLNRFKETMTGMIVHDLKKPTQLHPQCYRQF